MLELALKEYNKVNLIQLKGKRRETLVKERLHIPRMIQSWIFLKTFALSIKQAADEYNIKRESKRRINKFLTQLSICSRFLARVMRLWRVRRDNRLLQLMTKIVRANKAHWRFHRQFKHKRKVGGFLYTHKYTKPCLLLLKCATRSVVTIQRWYKWCFKKRIIFLALMLRQWSAIEHVVAKLKASLTDKQVYNLVQANIKKRSASKYTSTKFRAQAIESHLAVHFY